MKELKETNGNIEKIEGNATRCAAEGRYAMFNIKTNKQGIEPTEEQ